MTNETRKIWGDDSINAMATCIRVPVMRAHAESINLELAEEITEDEARSILEKAEGVSLIDDRCALVVVVSSWWCCSGVVRRLQRATAANAVGCRRTTSCAWMSPVVLTTALAAGVLCGAEGSAVQGPTR